MGMGMGMGSVIVMMWVVRTMECKEHWFITMVSKYFIIK